jgi:Co/Zn/Cd efflux system component
MSVTQRHWLLLVTVLALGVAAYVAFILGSGAAEAHTTGSYHWHQWNDAWGCAYRTLYYPSGGSTGITHFLMC